MNDQPILTYIDVATLIKIWPRLLSCLQSELFSCGSQVCLLIKWLYVNRRSHANITTMKIQLTKMHHAPTKLPGNYRLQDLQIKLIYASDTCKNSTYGPRQANLVLIAYASSEGSGEPAHPRSLARTFAARSYKQWIKRNLQTESQIRGPSEWLGMRGWNLSWRNARRHNFAWRGSYTLWFNASSSNNCRWLHGDS